MDKFLIFTYKHVKMRPCKITYLLLFGIIYLFSSCAKSKKEDIKPTQTNTLVKYAKGFDIQLFKKQIKLTINNPYQDSDTKFEYFLVKKNSDDPILKASQNTIQIPIKKVIATSTTHVPMIEALDEENSLVGFPNTNYVSSEKTRKLIDQGAIQEIGMDANLNTEIVIDLNPDLIIGFSVNARNKSLEAIKKSGIQVIYNGAWLEETPLGRAEWLKFFGALYDKMELADSIFNIIEENYLQLKKTGGQTQTQPTVLSGAMFKDIWNMPAGESFVAQFLKDANTNYLWKETKGTGSLQLNFENVLDQGQNAELWIGPGSYTSKEGLLNANPHYGNFNAFNTGDIYTFSKRKGTTGGTIYYELGALRPDLILKDIIKIAHPGLLKDEEFTFFDRME